MDKCPCGKAAIGSINEHPFCDNPDHIDSAVSDSFSPFEKEALAKANDMEGKG